jgi:hypothetical protein
MFIETTDVYPHEKVHIDIDPNAKPVHSIPHPVPQIHLKTFKKGRQQSMLDQQPTSTEQSHET